MSKLVEAAAEFLSRDTSTKQVFEDFEDNEMYIKLLSQEEFNELAEEDQNIYIDAIHQLQELSPETLRSYQKKANRSIDKQQKIKMTPGSPEAKARSVKGLTRMGAIDRANEKEFLGRMDRAIKQKKAGQ